MPRKKTRRDPEVLIEADGDPRHDHVVDKKSDRDYIWADETDGALRERDGFRAVIREPGGPRPFYEIGSPIDGQPIRKGNLTLMDAPKGTLDKIRKRGEEEQDNFDRQIGGFVKKHNGTAASRYVTRT